MTFWGILGKKHIFEGKLNAKCKFCGKRSRRNTLGMRAMHPRNAECPNGIGVGIVELMLGRINCYDDPSNHSGNKNL